MPATETGTCTERLWVPASALGTPSIVTRPLENGGALAFAESSRLSPLPSGPPLGFGLTYALTPVGSPLTLKPIGPVEVELRWRTSGTLAEAPGVRVVARLGPDSPKSGGMVLGRASNARSSMATWQIGVTGLVSSTKLMLDSESEISSLVLTPTPEMLSVSFAAGIALPPRS